MDWVWIVAAAWLPLAVVLALVVGRAIALADRQAADADLDALGLVVDAPQFGVG
jgi:hypothetical protein